MSDEPSPPDFRRAAFCQEHQLHYDPNDSGCALCRHGEAPPPPRLRSWVALAALGIPLLALLVFLTLPNPSGEEGGAPEEESWPELHEEPGQSGASTPTLDPTPYVREIRRLEALLYSHDSPSFDTAGKIGAAAERLANRLTAEGDSSEVLNRREAALAILDLAANLGLEEDSGYAMISLPHTRTRWEELRARVFREVPWFRSATTDLNVAQTPRATVVDPEVVEALLHVADDLASLLARGREEAMSIAEVTGEASPDRRAVESAWLAFSQRWERVLMEETPHLPAVPHDAQPASVQQARQSLAQAIDALHQLPVTAYSWTSVPALYERRRQLTLTDNLIDEARALLTREPTDAQH